MLDSRLLYQCMCLMAGMFPHLLLTKKVDAIFVWGRATDEWQATRYDDGVLKLAAGLHLLTGAPVAIPGYCGSDKGQGTTGYPGPQIWRDALTSFGVSGDQVVDTAGQGHNTKSEMDDFLELAVVRGWTTTVAITQQPYALRAMLGTVKTLIDLNLTDLVVVPAWAHWFDWNRECYGSQGDGPYPRVRWIDEEYERIPRYREKGDLASLEDLAQYLIRVHQQR